MEYKLQTCNRMNGIMKRNNGKQMSNETQHNSENMETK
jgi:hypothetical protein